ncbi:MAG: GtrA family protein [Gammaproteobacteria bacterium]
MLYGQLRKFIAKNKSSILSFSLVGLLTAAIYFSLFTLLWKILNVNYNIAISIAYLIAIVFYFFTNRHFTFKSNLHPMQGQAFKFLGMVIINYLVTLSVVHSSVELLTLPPYIGMILAIGTTTILSYLIAKFWVFKIKNQGEI